MKKIILFSVFIYLCIFKIYSDSLIDKFNILGKRPEINKIVYNEDSQIILANCKSADLVLDFSDNNNCVVHIQTKNSKLESVCDINKNMLEGIYQFNLDISVPCLLVCYYAEGATGLSANIMKGLLIKFDDEKIELIQLSTFGAVYKNFIDINNDNVFEFIWIDLFYNTKIDYERLFIANYFFLSDGIKNISDKNQLKIINFYDGEIVVKKQNEIDYRLLSKPSIF